MVKITVFREDNQPVLHLQRRQSASASHFEKTILPMLKKTILLEKTILPFPVWGLSERETFAKYKKHSNRVMGYRVCQLNLSITTYQIDEW